MPEGYTDEFDFSEDADGDEESPILEDLSEESVDEPAEEEAVEDAATIESLASELGWKPKDDFQGHEDDYVDAATYIRRSKDIQDGLRQHLKDNKKKLSSLERGLDDLRVHNERVFKAELRKQKEEIKALKAQRREAIEEGDVERVEEIEEKMENLAREESSDEPEYELDPEQYEVFSSWLKDNAWYHLENVTEGNKALSEYADKLADSPEYQAMPYNLRLRKVTSKVMEMFPEEFPGNGKQKKPASNAVEAPSLKGGKRKYSARDLSPDQKAIMRNFVRNGIMKEQEYIDDLAKMGEIE